MAPAPTPPTTEMSNLTVQETAPAPGFKGTAKRDALRANEISIQAQWEKDSVFQSDHSDAHKEKFIVTFPFPYSNGHLHIGHAFSLTKSVFRAQFERHLGKNVLFPFAFHCTGMPIQAVSSLHLNYVVLNIIICCVELNIIWMCCVELNIIICWAILLHYFFLHSIIHNIRFNAISHHITHSIHHTSHNIISYNRLPTSSRQK